MKPDVEDLERVRDELREQIREAHGVLKDLRREIKQAREQIPLLTEERFEAEVSKQVDALAKANRKQMDLSTAKVIGEFDKLANILMGRTRREEAQDLPSIPEYVEAIRAEDQSEAGT